MNLRPVTPSIFWRMPYTVSYPLAKPPAPSMLSLPGASKRVIYSGTYSKPFATGIRVGFGISPSPLHQTLCHPGRANQDFGTAEFLQAILEKALSSGSCDRHLEVIRKGYAKKSDRMCRMIQRHFPASKCLASPGRGLYVWARLPQPNQTGLIAHCSRLP